MIRNTIQWYLNLALNNNLDYSIINKTYNNIIIMKNHLEVWMSLCRVKINKGF